jgi:hypothetical protein
VIPDLAPVDLLDAMHANSLARSAVSPDDRHLNLAGERAPLAPDSRRGVVAQKRVPTAGEEGCLLARKRWQLATHNRVDAMEDDLQAPPRHPVRDHVAPTPERDELLVAHDRPLRAGKRRHRTVPPLIQLAHDPTLGTVATASVELWATTVIAVGTAVAGGPPRRSQRER